VLTTQAPLRRTPVVLIGRIAARRQSTQKLARLQPWRAQLNPGGSQLSSLEHQVVRPSSMDPNGHYTVLNYTLSSSSPRDCGRSQTHSTVASSPHPRGAQKGAHPRVISAHPEEIVPLAAG